MKTKKKKKRLYVSTNVSTTFMQKVTGKIASWTQEVGTSHLGIIQKKKKILLIFLFFKLIINEITGVQIADKIFHWFNCGLAIPKVKKKKT